MLHRLVSVPVVILALALPADAASRRVSERRSIEPDGTLSIELLSGSVRIVGGGGSEIEVTGTIGEDVESVTLEGSERHARIEVELRDARNLSDASAELEVRVPKGVTVEIESVGADVTVDGLTSAVSIESVHGDAQVAAGPGEVHVTSVSGPITISGGSSLRELQLETVSGPLEFRGPLNRSGEYSLESVSGSVTLDIEGSVSAAFEISTFGGTIDSALGPKPRRESKMLPGTSLSFTEGAGDADVTIASFSGAIRVRRK
jgi:Putative adhesin